MRKPLIVGNWKMNKTIKEAIELINGLKRELIDTEEVDIVVSPAYTALCKAGELLRDSNIKLGAQDVYWQSYGAFTGEVSGPMLKDVGCEYVIVGHSERRAYFFESNDMVNKKIKASLEVKLTPICCVGESLSEREREETFVVVEGQLNGCFKNLNDEDMLRLVIAYEPIWAIGTGKTATVKQAEEVHKFIRDWTGKNFSLEVASNLRILYGGSVQPSHIKELIHEENIDGVLVGGASLDILSFSKIVKNAISQ